MGDDASTLIAAARDDRYIERELAGGVSVVYLAPDCKLDREVAFDVLRPVRGLSQLVAR